MPWTTPWHAAPASRHATVDATRPRRALPVIFVVSGFCGLIYESIWSHYLKLFVGHAAYAQTVVLIVFIGGMALGAWLIGRFAQRIALAAARLCDRRGRRSASSRWSSIRLFVASTDWGYASLLPAACVPESPCVAQWVFAALLILPQSILLGTTFPLMTARHPAARAGATRAAASRCSTS